MRHKYFTKRGAHTSEGFFPVDRSVGWDWKAVLSEAVLILHRIVMLTIPQLFQSSEKTQFLILLQKFMHINLPMKQLAKYSCADIIDEISLPI
jgi:hypothetical protein